jgi:hypothetical protein
VQGERHAQDRPDLAEAVRSGRMKLSEALVEKLFSGTAPEQQRDTALHRYPQGGAISIDEAPPAEAPKAIRIRVVPPAIAGQIQQCGQIAGHQVLSSPSTPEH